MVSPLSYGQDKHAGKKSPRPIILKYQVERFVNFGIGFPNSFSDSEFAKHRQEQRLLYFYGRDGYEAGYQESLLMIDVDNHNCGSAKAADEFLKHVEKLIDREVFIEQSGGGVHGYIVIDVTGQNAKTLKQCYKEFEKALKRLAVDFDIENVEVKGTPIEIGGAPCEAGGSLPVTDEEREIAAKLGCQSKVVPELSVKFGSLATLPKYITEDELLSLPVVETYDLVAFADSIPVREPPALAKKQIGSVCLDISVGNVHHTAAAKALELAGVERLIAGTRQATAEDIAIFLCILQFCFDHANKGGSLPTERIKSIWCSLFMNGQVERGYSDQKVRLMRNMLSSIHWLDWSDNSFGAGQAMRWSLAVEVVDLLSIEISKGIFTYSPDVDSHLKDVHDVKMPAWTVRSDPKLIQYQRFREMEHTVMRFVGQLAA